MVRYLQNLINHSSGFTAIEYALIAALMAVAGDSRVCLSRHQPQQDLAKDLAPIRFTDFLADCHRSRRETYDLL